VARVRFFDDACKIKRRVVFFCVQSVYTVCKPVYAVPPILHTGNLGTPGCSLTSTPGRPVPAAGARRCDSRVVARRSTSSGRLRLIRRPLRSTVCPSAAPRRVHGPLNQAHAIEPGSARASVTKGCRGGRGSTPVPGAGDGYLQSEMPAAAAVFFCAALLSTVLDDATAAGAGPLVMHHIGSCSECGRSAQGSRASWCPCPNASNPSCKGAANGNCTQFVFDAGHLKGQPLSPTTCAQLPPHAETYCLKGTQDLWAAVPCPEPCHLPTPPPAPTFPPTTFHIPFNGRGSGHGGCCADINAISEHNGVKHLFKQSGGVHDPTSSGLGFAHYISDDFVRWKYLSTIVTPGGADGSLTFGLPGGPVILWDCTSAGACTGGPEADTSSSHQRAAETDDDRSQTGSRTNSQGCQSGDAAIIGVARPTNASDPKLEHWTKDGASRPIHTFYVSRHTVLI
jgi:hypothetical protein